MIDWNNLGYSYHLDGQNVRAIDTYERALQINSKEVVLLNNLAYAYHSIGEIENALKACKRGLEIDQNYEKLVKLKDKLLK